jgi:hypothetical protein
VNLLIGPATSKFPSWQWCAADLVPHLERGGCVVRTFSDFRELHGGSHDRVLVVKHPVPDEVIFTVGRLAYMPVDFFTTPQEITARTPFLGRCDVVASHCDRLGLYLAPYCREIVSVEHYGKYVLPNPPEWRRDGLVLWTGQRDYAPLVCDWYTRRARGFQITLLSNESPSRRDQSGINSYRWTPEGQRALTRVCRAGLDVKGDNFAQMTKPATKVQQFVASGVPCAVNRGSWSWEYFHQLGLDLADPDDEARWFSESYRDEVAAFGRAYRSKITPEAVAASYLRFLT